MSTPASRPRRDDPADERPAPSATLPHVGVTGHSTPHGTVSPDTTPLTNSDMVESPVTSPRSTGSREAPMAGSERNWAGVHEYAGARLVRPTSAEELAEIVAAPRGPAIGSRGTRSPTSSTATCSSRWRRCWCSSSTPTPARSRSEAGAVRREVARAHARGWALANLASLPHISVAGAVATATHGSGDTNASLATAVAALTLLDGSGESRRFDAVTRAPTGPWSASGRSASSPR